MATFSAEATDSWAAKAIDEIFSKFPEAPSPIVKTEVTSLTSQRHRLNSSSYAIRTSSYAIRTSLTAQDIKKVNEQKNILGYQNLKRIALLGILLAETEAVSFGDLAQILLVKEKVLESYIHGESLITNKVEERAAKLIAIFRNLQSVLRKSAATKWLNTAIPRFENRTPMDELTAGNTRKVLLLTESYLNEDFV